MTIKIKTNIILANLTEEKLTKVLQLCNDEKIHYTFDKDYYSNKFFDIISMLNNIVIKNEKLPIEYKKLIDNEYKDYLEDADDVEGLDKIKNLKYSEK